MKSIGWLIVLTLCSTLRIWGAEARAVSISVPGMGGIEGISPSPAGKRIAAYKVPAEEEGEYVTGYPILIDFSDSSRPRVKTLDLPGTFMDGTRPVWSKDGKSVYILSDKIYKVSADGSKVEVLAVEADHGLALSPSNRRLAFWRSALRIDDTLVLVVYDLAEQKEIRNWRVPRNYASESYGFDIAFADEDRVYAQTYDEGLEEVRTPLKLFDVANGGIKKITDRCSSVVNTKRGVFFVTHDLSEKRFEVRNVAKAATPLSRIKATPFVRLSNTGRHGWLAVESLHKHALLDTTKNRITKEVRGCDSITVLVDGRVIYGHKGRLSSDRRVCRSAGIPQKETAVQ